MANIRNILIMGGGMMGKNIAFIFSSRPDYSITVYDINKVDIEKDIRANCRQLLEKGVVTEPEMAERLKRIRFTMDIDDEGIGNADLVIEAVYEDMALKKDTFAKLEQRCRRECIFCTNTSVMSPTEISSEMRYRDRFCGTHFWNPGHLIPLVEVVRTEKTSDETINTVMETLKSVGKKPCLCKKDVPGFIGNRMQHALWREAISIVENDIADAATVDEVVKNSFGLRLPQVAPMENADMVGTELSYQCQEYILPYLENSTVPSPLLSEHLKEGKLGFKSGEGFQKWTKEEVDERCDALNEYLIRMLYGK
ncbi:MAG: 3-hydroxyacyl-CoA dehydrogenase NAD-binding domain-containing protein [Oscillospiraceae bacterium]|nr:3-hydroxyacyl-CoA dehydrogenase NAD-binding domain-containing protein [Oscillospiraceae bacterium]